MLMPISLYKCSESCTDFLLTLVVLFDMLYCNVFFSVYIYVSVQFNTVTKIILSLGKTFILVSLIWPLIIFTKQMKIFTLSVKLLLTNSRIYQAFWDWHNPVFWAKIHVLTTPSISTVSLLCVSDIWIRTSPVETKKTKNID